MNLDSGLLHTAQRLTVSPGRVVRDYLVGRTISYTHPAAYLLISFAAFALTGRELAGATGFEGHGVFAAPLIPFVAAMSRLLFWRTRLNYAEHLILVMYVLGHVALFFAALFAATPLTGNAIARFLAIGVLVLSAAYVSWAYSRVFPSRALLAAAGGLIALAGGLVLWMVALVMLLNALRR